MEIDFFLLQVDDYRIKVIDNTLPNEIVAPAEITSALMDIICTKIPNIEVRDIDLIPYIFTYKKDKELYEITSEVLGLPKNQIIPDGVYTITVTFNNIYQKVHKFCVFNTIKKQVDQLVQDTEYAVTIGNYDITYTGDNCEGDIEKVRLAVALLDSLRYAASIGNEVNCNDILDKLNRLLTIIE